MDKQHLERNLLVLLDLSNSAFDSFGHSVLLGRLHPKFSISGTVLESATFTFPLMQFVFPVKFCMSFVLSFSRETCIMGDVKVTNGFVPILREDHSVLLPRVLIKCRQPAIKPATWRFEPSTFWGNRVKLESESLKLPTALSYEAIYFNILAAKLMRTLITLGNLSPKFSLD